MAGEARKAYRVIRLSASTNQRAIFAATRRDAPILADCRVARRLWTFSPRRSSLLALGQNRQRRGRDDYGNRAWALVRLLGAAVLIAGLSCTPAPAAERGKSPMDLYRAGNYQAAVAAGEAEGSGQSLAVAAR